MLLSRLKKIGSLEIIRNASFGTLGFISDPQKDMLIFIESSSHGALIRGLEEVSCVVTKKELVENFAGIKGLAVSDNPRLSFYKMHNYLAKTSFYWKDFPTQIAGSAKVHPTALIAKKNVRIGPDTVIEANAIIPERCLIGRGVKIMAGVVLGSIGLQVTRFREGVLDMIHAGGIRIDNNVQIMPNSVIAYAVFGQLTTIGQDSRIGNLTFISHNVKMGLRCFVGHGSVINGNVMIGDDVWIGPGTTLSNNIIIGSNTRVCLGSTVIDNVGPGQSIIGCVAIDKKKMLGYMKSIRGQDA